MLILLFVTAQSWNLSFRWSEKCFARTNFVKTVFIAELWNFQSTRRRTWFCAIGLLFVSSTFNNFYLIYWKTGKKTNMYQLITLTVLMFILIAVYNFCFLFDRISTLDIMTWRYAMTQTRHLGLIFQVENS